MIRWVFPKIGGTFLGVHIIKTIVFWGPFLGSPYLGKLPYRDLESEQGEQAHPD